MKRAPHLARMTFIIHNLEHPQLWKEIRRWIHNFLVPLSQWQTERFQPRRDLFQIRQDGNNVCRLFIVVSKLYMSEVAKSGNVKTAGVRTGKGGEVRESVRIEGAKGETVGDKETGDGGDRVEKGDEGIDEAGAGRVDICRPSVLCGHAHGELCDGREGVLCASGVEVRGGLGRPIDVEDADGGDRRETEGVPETGGGVVHFVADVPEGKACDGGGREDIESCEVLGLGGEKTVVEKETFEEWERLDEVVDERR